MVAHSVRILLLPLHMPYLHLHMCCQQSISKFTLKVSTEPLCFYVCTFMLQLVPLMFAGSVFVDYYLLIYFISAVQIQFFLRRLCWNTRKMGTLCENIL